MTAIEELLKGKVAGSLSLTPAIDGLVKKKVSFDPGVKLPTTANSTPVTTNVNVNPLTIAKDIGQFAARSVGTVGITAGNLPYQLAGQPAPFESSIPTTGNKVTEALFGGKPIETFNQRSINTQKGTEPFLGKSVSTLLAPTLVMGSIAMDLSGFGGPKKVTTFTKGLVPESFFKTIAKDAKPETIIETLKGVGFNVDDAIKLSTDLADAKTTQAVKDVFLGFEKSSTDNALVKMVISKNPDEIATFLSNLPAFPTSKIPLVARIVAPMSDPKKINTIIDGVIQGEAKVVQEQKQAHLEILKNQIDSNPLKSKPNDRLLFSSKEGQTISLADAKSPKQVKYIEDRMAEAGYSDPQKFLDDYQALQENKVRVKELEKEVKSTPSISDSLSKAIEQDVKNYVPPAEAQANKLSESFANLASDPERQARVAKYKYSAEGIPMSTRTIQPSTLPELPPKAEAPKFVREPDIPVPKSIAGQINRNIRPLEYVDNDTKDVLRGWNSDKIVGREMANQTATSIKIEGDSMDLIHSYQAGENIPQAPQIKKIFDDLRKEAIARGIDVKERQNYVPQVYKGSPKDVQGAIFKYMSDHGVNDEMIQDYISGANPLPEEVANRLKLTPSFEKERVFANYRVAEEYGLKPKYETVADLAAYYRDELNKAVANKKLIESLASKGKIVPTGSAPKEWKPINSEFSSKIQYSAPANTAKVLNDIFADPDLQGAFGKTVEKVAGASKLAQEVALSAGVPNTTVNFFAIGQLVKELTAGNTKVVGAFLRANSDSATAKFFEKHKDTLIDMAKEGIDITNRAGSFNQKELVELLKDKEFKQALGHGLDIAFGKKTFESFMPMMQVQLFEDVVKASVKSGLPIEEAKKIAGDTLRKNFGLNTDAFAQGKLTKDTLSASFFAPKFRGTIIKSLYETGKAGGGFIKYLGTGGKAKIDPSSKRNLRLLGGMILSFGIYNSINRELNDGQNMWDNPSGKEFALRIPQDDGTVIYLEFMPSYLAFARNMASAGIATAKGDFKTAGQKFGSLFSMPIKITAEVITNKDYFGNPIYKDTDSTKTKLSKIALYTGLAVNHPYVKEVVNQINDKKPVYQSVITALELPLKFSTTDKESTSAFYNALDAKAKETAGAKEKFSGTFNEIQDLIRQGKLDEAKSMFNSLTEEQHELYKTMKTSLKTSATFSGKAKMYETYNTIQDLIKKEKREDAKIIFNSLSEDEHRYYELLKKQFGSSKAVEKKEDGVIKKAVNAVFGVKTAEASAVPMEEKRPVAPTRIDKIDFSSENHMPGAVIDGKEIPIDQIKLAISEPKNPIVKINITKSNGEKAVLTSPKQLAIANRIKAVADKIRPEYTNYLLKMAFNESTMGMSTMNDKNTNGSVDNGVFQINDKAFPMVSAAQANDLDFAILFAIGLIDAGKQKRWSSDEKNKKTKLSTEN